MNLLMAEVESGCFIGEMILIWEVNKLAIDKVYTPVSPLMGAKAPFKTFQKSSQKFQKIIELKDSKVIE